MGGAGGDGNGMGGAGGAPGAPGGPNDPTGPFRGLANQLMSGQESATPADPALAAAHSVAGGGHSGIDPYAAAIAQQEKMFQEIKAMYQPYMNAGLGGLKQMQGASTIKGLDKRLAKIFDSDTFSALHDERLGAVQQQLARSGLTRSGAAMTEMAQLSTQTGLDIESMLYGRSRDLAGMGLNATHGTAGAGQNAANNISNAHLTQAGHELQQTLAEMGFAHASSENALNRDFQAEQSALDRQFRTNAYNDANKDTASDWVSLGLMAAFAFSDRELKENVRKVGEAKGLGVYEWEWIEEAPDFVKEQPKMGFMADEVEEVYPQFVREIGSYKAVDYQGIMGV